MNQQTRVVRADAYRAIEGLGFCSEGPFPDQPVIREYFHFVCIDFGAEIVGVSGSQNGNWGAAAWLDIAVSAIRAFGAGVLTGIAFHRNNELRFGFDAPHGIHEVAGILRAKFETELAAEFTGAQHGFVAGGTKQGEVRLNELGCEGVNIRAHFGDGDEQAVVGGFLNCALGDAEVCARNNREFGCGGVGQLSEGQQR